MNDKIKPKDFFNNRAQKYHSLSKWVKNKEINNKTFDFIDKLNGQIALELGAGSGVLITRVKNFHIKIAFDISSNMLSLIEDEHVKKVIGDIHNLSFLDNSTDMIICRQVLHYCNLNSAFFNIKKVLKIGGFLHIVQVVEFKNVPQSWDQEWASIRNVENRKHLRTKEIETYYDKYSLKIMRFEKIISANKYTWKEFLVKHNVNRSNESKVINFFKNTPKSIANKINLSLDENEISYNRTIAFWLLKSY